MLKFDKDLCVADLKNFFNIEKITEETEIWINSCDKKLVKNGRINGFNISKEWCIEIPEEIIEPKKPKIKKDKRKSRFLV